VSLIQVVNT